MNFLVIGESCLDVFVYGRVERLAPDAPVPVFNKESVINNPGMASNVERNLRGLGCDVTLSTNPNWTSIRKTRYVEGKSNHMFLRVDEGDESYGNCKISKINFEKYDCVIISDYNKGWLTSEQIHEIGRRSKISVLDTKKILGEWAETMSFIKINETEFDRTKDVLTEKIIDKLIVTLGPRGAMFQGTTYPSPDVKRVDSCCAGDTFVASFAKEFTSSKDIERSIKFANESASIVIQQRGVTTL
jgi:D-beta-D-heptose 7-phosphate kinase/D-beta-D-heptose 1-phosphate adenosyltransferase